MNILLIEPYYGGSHKAWADGYQKYSNHKVELLTLPANYWKWRMQGGAVSLAQLYNAGHFEPDVILATDMFDLSTFRALTRHATSTIPTALYCHENQLTYPRNSRQEHYWQYGFINYTSALAADAVYFNSEFHQDSFLNTVPVMLKHFADWNELETVPILKAKSSVLPLGLDLRRFDSFRVAHTQPRGIPLIVWNHRWEEDKQPDIFLKALYNLQKREIPFRVALMGENVRHHASEFIEACERLGDQVTQFGYVESFEDYARILCAADLVVSTAIQDFFGAAIAESIYCGCVPILPNRLNYPALVPHELHADCLYAGNDLYPLMLMHLRNEKSVDREMLIKQVAQFDWATIAQQMDTVLSLLAQAR